MKFKKLAVLLLASVMILMLAACAPTDKETDPTAPAETTTPADDPPLTEPQEPEETKEPEEAIKVALLLPGSINDDGWNAAGYSGLAHLESMGVPVAYTENVAPSDQEDFMRGYVDLGYDIIIGHSSGFADAVKKVASEFPDTYFYISNADVDNSQEPNVACFGAPYSGYLAGLVAGAISETGVVAGIGGERTISITPNLQLFEAGAKQMNPDIKVFTSFVGSLTDADKAKEMALDNIRNGNADVVWPCADAAGLGVLQAAADEGVYAIGMNQDQYDANPDAVVVSVLRNFVHMFESIYNEVNDGTFEPKVYVFGVENNGSILSDWHGWDEKFPAEKIAKIQQVLDDVIAGKIEVPKPGGDD